MSIPGLKYLCRLPDGGAVAGMCVLNGRLIVACQNGSFYELEEENGAAAARFEPIPIDLSPAPPEVERRDDGSMELRRRHGTIKAEVLFYLPGQMRN